MQKVQGKKEGSRRSSAVLLGALLLFAPLTAAAAGDGNSSTVLTGVVRDAHGVVQMGVLIEVLAPGLGAIGSTFTDEHGRYTISNLGPGRYRVRATAALFAPATRPVLEVSNGAHAVVNLTLAALFDTASWLPAERRRPDEPKDDWTWTLRSSANRPILRFDENSTIDTTSTDSAGRRQVHGSLSAAGGTAEIGQPQMQEALLLQQQLTGGSKAIYRLASGDAVSGAVDAAAGWERTQSDGDGFRTLIRFRALPQVQTGAEQGTLESVSMENAQQITLGAVKLEAGGNLQIIHAGAQTLVANHPFFRLTAMPGGSWRIQYRLATERGGQQAADLEADQDSGAQQQGQVLVAADPVGKLQTETGRHQELSLAHDVASGRLQLGYFHDDRANVVLAGTGASGAVPALLTQRGTGGFTVLANGYTTNGASVSYTVPLREGIWVTAEYAFGDALSYETVAAGSVGDALHGVKARSSQTALIALRGHIRRSGTQVRSSYRWQPEGDVSAVDAYNGLNPHAFLGLFVRQQLRLGSWIPTGLEGTIDVSNLLAQGYRPFLSEDGNTLYLTQTPRTVQVGLAFNF